MAAKRKTWVGRVYLGRDPDTGRERYRWVGRYKTKRERDDAVARARLALTDDERAAALPPGERITVADYAADVLARMEDGRLRTRGGRRFKPSTLDTYRSQLRPLVDLLGDRTLGSVERHEAIAAAERLPRHALAAVVTLFARAVDEELVERNPFRGLSRRTRGRSDERPPSEREFQRLLNACSALGGYAHQMRNLLVFAAYTGMRPGELFALEWRDVDFACNRVHVRRRLYRGGLDLPKSNTARVIALPPPARDRLLSQPTRGGRLVFMSKTGVRLSQPVLSGYWAQVKAAAGLELDFYLSTKHYGVALLYRLGLSRRAIAAQMGWSESAVDALLRVYGHADLVALGEVDALYESGKVVPLRAVGSDAASDAVPG